MVQALDRGLEILELLAERDDMSITEIAGILKVDKSTVSRLMETLRYHDMVQLNKSTKKYQLGLRILHLGNSLEKNLNIIDIAKPVIKDISEELKLSVHLCAFNNNMAYVIDQVERKNEYSVSATIGMIEPMHASSVGKCILAYRREDMLTQMLEGYEYIGYTDKTILNEKDLRQELEAIKKQGYAVDNEEVTAGVRCVAVPVFGFANYVRYSIGISGTAEWMTGANIKLCIDKLSRAAKKISKELGYQSTQEKT